MKVPQDYTNPEIGIDSLPPIVEVELNPLEPRYHVQMLLSVSMVYIILLAIFSVFYFLILNSGDMPLWPYLVIVGLLLIIWVCNLFWMKKAYNFRGYAIREKDISMRRGLFFRKYRTVPFSNIQQVSVQQGPLSRPFKLYSLEIEDASQSGVGLSIPGLTKERAHQLKDFLLDKIS